MNKIYEESKIKLSKYDTNKLRDLAGILGADKKKLYGTSKDAIIRVIDDIRMKSKPTTYSVLREVEVGDFSKDRMEIDSFHGTVDDIIKKYLSGTYGKILRVDPDKGKIIVERKIIEAFDNTL